MHVRWLYSSASGSRTSVQTRKIIVSTSCRFIPRFGVKPVFKANAKTWIALYRLR